MFPLFVMSALHLRLEKPAELAFDRPTNPISLLIPTLNNVLAVRQYVSVNPNRLVDNQLCKCFSLLVLLSLSALYYTPESLTASMRMLAKSAGADSQTRRVFQTFELVICQNGV